MAISRIGASGAEANSITIPGSYQAGDLMIIFAFNRTNTTVPSLPTGWTSLGTTSANRGSRWGWKIAGSASETSGTWTNATATACSVYRGTSTNKVPVINGNSFDAGGLSVTYQAMTVNSLKVPLSQWLVFFAAYTQIDTTIETAPTSLVLQSDTVGASNEIVNFDSNGAYQSSTYTSNSILLTGTSGFCALAELAIFPEELGNLNNYQSIDVGDGMSVTEKIR